MSIYQAHVKESAYFRIVHTSASPKMERFSSVVLKLFQLAAHQDNKKNSRHTYHTSKIVLNKFYLQILTRACVWEQIRLKRGCVVAKHTRILSSF